MGGWLLADAMGLGATTAPSPAGVAVCGAFVAAWGSPAGGQFYTPYTVVVDASGNILVGDSKSPNPEGRPCRNVVTAWGSTGSANGEFELPWAVAVAAGGDAYVADSGNERVRKFDRTM